jgi:hypothetical protein
MYHRLGALVPPDNERVQYAQVYIYDGDEMIQAQQGNFGGLQRDILNLLNNLLRQHNPYVTSFKMAYQRTAENPDLRLRLRMVDTRAHDPRRYNRPISDEIAGMIVGDENSERKASRDIVIEHQRNGFQRVSELNPSYFPLRYPFMFLYGEQGWHAYIPLSRIDIEANPELLARRRNNLDADRDDNEIDDGDDDDGDDDDGDDEGGEPRHGRGGSTRVSQAQFYNYHFQRRAEFSPLQYGGRLSQEIIIDAWVCVESSRLNFQRMNQKQLRVDLYSGLRDAIGGGLEENAQRLGQQIILSSTFIGGPRYMRQQYQDAMAICRHFGKPDLFITFTCNPMWQEIQEALLPGQKPEDAPHIVARVFHLKLKALLDDLFKHNVLGKVVARVYVIEFQKRGLPHAHILLILDQQSKFRTVDEIDRVVCAEFPDPDIDPELFRIVKTNMLHGPCTPERCIKNGRCSKRYPKQFAEETTWNEDGYPVYRRRNDGRTVEVRRHIYDNRSVVPYNPYLSKRYNAHINVEICSTVRAFKYLYKYVYKGGDRATVALGDPAAPPENNDEIRNYLDVRYVGPCEAAWRLSQFEMQGRSPAICRLQVDSFN